jgi:hypothetical protein
MGNADEAVLRIRPQAARSVPGRRAMNTRFASLLLTSACAVGICGVAMAQNMNTPAQQPAPAPAGQTAAAPGMEQGLPVDQQTTVAGTQVMCGGIGSDESDPRYANYPAKIEVAGGYGQWVGDNDITIAGHGQNVAAHCRGPWFMAQLAPGSYNVTIHHGSISHTARLSVAANGQHKIVVRFPELQRGKDDGQGQFSGQQTNNGQQTPNSSN